MKIRLCNLSGKQNNILITLLIFMIQKNLKNPNLTMIIHFQYLSKLLQSKILFKIISWSLKREKLTRIWLNSLYPNLQFYHPYSLINFNITKHEFIYKNITPSSISQLLSKYKISKPISNTVSPICQNPYIPWTLKSSPNPLSSLNLTNPLSLKHPNKPTHLALIHRINHSSQNSNPPHFFISKKP